VAPTFDSVAAQKGYPSFHARWQEGKRHGSLTPEKTLQNLAKAFTGMLFQGAEEMGNP
jgi:hypothetical protein